MNFESLISLVGSVPYFDLQTVVQLSGESRPTLRIQLHRWCALGKVTPLRRGMYALGLKYRHVQIGAGALANGLYGPSYLSFQWALGWYGMIPEMVVTYTSATTRSPRVFRNELGTFSYKHMKTDFFFGYRAVEIDGMQVHVATPEKALLDFWSSEPGEWTEERMASMRFQGFEKIGTKRLNDFSARWNSPRLIRAVNSWKAYVKTETRGSRVL